MKKKSVFKMILLGVILLVFLLLSPVFYGLIHEYKPEAVENLDTKHTAQKTLELNQPFRVSTWNIGYCGLDAAQDFFMDGGKIVNPASKEQVKDNLNHITSFAKELDSDIYLFQEADERAKRSFKINEVEHLEKSMNELHPFQSAFAYNFHVPYIPYPMPTLGTTYAGILTLSQFQADEAQRIAFPSSFKWPVSAFNLKRCLLVERIPVENSDKELILINLHLEAYDDGGGRALQTKMLSELMQKEYEKGNYIIAGGDFNSTLPSVDPDKYPLLETDYFNPARIDASVFPEGFQFITDDSEPSTRLLNKPYDPKDKEHTQFYVLDGFILSPNISCEEVKTDNLEYQWSDHNPVSIQVYLKP